MYDNYDCKRKDCWKAKRCVHEGPNGFCWEKIERISLYMPRELTDDQADAAMRATAVHLDIKGSQLTVNREKMKARYRALVKFIEASK